MEQLRFTRYSEWWEYKLVPLVSIGYATLLVTGSSVDQSIWRLFFLLVAVIIGAVYVSVINDLTDIREDAIAGKENWMAKTKPIVQVAILGFCLSLGVFCGYQIFPDRLSLFFYAMAWIVFSLYSIPPFRLKKRGIWGLLSDAMGAHLFPTLLISTNLIYLNYKQVDLGWLLATGIWALMCGLRGILSHQFSDRQNDLKSGTTTYASKIEPENFKAMEFTLFFLEVAAFSVLLFYTINLWIFLALLFYIGLVLIRKFVLENESCLIITPANKPYQFLMNDFYLVFFPISLLFTIMLSNPYGWIILCVHLTLFPQRTFIAIKDVLLSLKKILYGSNSSLN